MAKGKHAAKAENRNLLELHATIEGLQNRLAELKDEVDDDRKEIRRLKAIEAVFDDTKDVIAELSRVRKQKDELEGRNFVLQVRIDRWAKMMVEESNIEFLRLTPDFWSDLVELGYYTPKDDDPRWMKRSYASKARFKKAADIGRNGGKVIAHG